MPPAHIGRLLAAALALPAMAAAQKVTVEFDQGADFTRYKSFTMRAGRIASKQPSLNNDLVRKRIEGEIRRRLGEKGLSEVERQPDLNVGFSLGSANRRQVERYPAGWRGWGTRRVAVRYTEGTLVIDLRDARTRELVWRAIAVDEERDPSRIQGHIENMVKKSFQRYPPGAKR
jgi:hypothetical protein